MTVTRRTVARGAAWSIPAVAIGVSAPAAKASEPHGGCGVEFTLEGVCKFDAHNHGKGKSLRLTLSVMVTTRQPVTIVAVTVAGHTTYVGQKVWATPVMIETDPVPNGDLSGPNTPVVIEFMVGRDEHVQRLAHGPIKDCRR